MRPAVLAIALMLAGCGMGDGAEDAPAPPGNGEIQALANAKAMLDSREDKAPAAMPETGNDGPVPQPIEQPIEK